MKPNTLSLIYPLLLAILSIIPMHASDSKQDIPYLTEQKQNHAPTPQQLSSAPSSFQHKKNTIVNIFQTLTEHQRLQILTQLSITHHALKPIPKIYRLFPLQDPLFTIRMLQERDAQYLYDAVNAVTKMQPSYYQHYQVALTWAINVEANKNIIKHPDFSDAIGTLDLGVWHHESKRLIGILVIQRTKPGPCLDLGYYRLTTQHGRGCMARALWKLSEALVKNGHTTYLVMHKDNTKSYQIARNSGHQVVQDHHDLVWQYPDPKQDSIICQKTTPTYFPESILALGILSALIKRLTHPQK